MSGEFFVFSIYHGFVPLNLHNKDLMRPFVLLKIVWIELILSL